jgi:RHS repeat-associated protein
MFMNPYFGFTFHSIFCPDFGFVKSMFKIDFSSILRSLNILFLLRPVLRSALSAVFLLFFALDVFADTVPKTPVRYVSSDWQYGIGAFEYVTAGEACAAALASRNACGSSECAASSVAYVSSCVPAAAGGWKISGLVVPKNGTSTIRQFADGITYPENCPENSSPNPEGTCNCNAGYSSINGSCVVDIVPEKNVGTDPNGCNGSNPINGATGNKTQVETDYIGVQEKALSLRRTYNSISPTNIALSRPSMFGPKWRSNFDRSLEVSSTVIRALADDGKMTAFMLNGSIWVPDSDVKARLESVVGSTDWRYTDLMSGEVSLYDGAGRLKSIVSRDGYMQLLNYSTASTPMPVAPVAGLLIGVTDSFDRHLDFSYDSSSRVRTMGDPTGGEYIYDYDGNGNLISVTYPDTKIRIYKYNESSNGSIPIGSSFIGALTGIVDENGSRFATWKYDNAGRAISSEHNILVGATLISVEKVSFAYSTNTNGSVVSSSVTDALNTARTYSFDHVLGVARNTGVSQPCSSCSSAAVNAQSYDGNGNIASRTDFNNNKTTYIYDLARNLETSRTEGLTSAGATTPQTRTITTTWHATYRLPLTITEPGKTTTFTYDANGNQLTKTIADTALSTSRTWTYTYNTLGQVLTADGPRTDVADVTTYTYYPAASSTPGSVHSIGDLATVTNALGHVTTITNYDLNGRPLSITDPNGVVTTMTYSPRGWLMTRTVNGVQTTTYDYDGVGQLTKATLPDGSYLNYTYDAAHRLTDIEDNAGNKIHYTLDAMGNRTQEDTKDPANNILKTRARVFDALNRLKQDIGGSNPSTQITEYGYDSNGNLKTVTDPLARITTNDYDPLNRLITITDPATPTPGVTRNAYNARDQLTQVKDPRLVTTDYTVDALGNVSLTQSPDSGNTTSLHDAAGNVVQKTDARGVVSQYSYDALNRLTEIVYPANTAANVGFIYDYENFAGASKGRLSYIMDADGFVIVGAYDEYGNVLTKADWLSTVSTASEYAYDSANRVIGITYPSGRIVTYTRNSLGQVTQVQLQDSPSAPPQTLANAITYKPFGPISSLAFGNGVNTTWLYDADYRVTRITATSTPNWDYTYHYDAVGNIDELTDQVGTNDRLYAYDRLDRITQDKKPLFGGPGLVEYQYDAGGNRTLWKQVISYPHIYAANSNRQIQYGASTMLLQDNAGNLTAYGSKVFSYDSANRMSMSVVGSTSTTYRYNGLGQRTTKLVTTGGNTVVTHYDYDKDGRYLGQLQLNPDGTFAHGDEYIWLDDMPIAQVHTTYGINNAIASQQLTYIHADHLNTPRAMTDSTKKIVWKWESEAYGRNVPNTDPDADGILNKLDLRFPGQIADAETGFYYNMNRYYDPMMGRYTQSDPIGLEGGLNTYRYVEGNPLSYVDPSGLARVSADCKKLREVVVRECKQLLSGCRQTDSCSELKGKIVTFLSCAVAQAGYTMKCEPNNPSHQQRISDLVNGVENCQNIMRDKNCGNGECP